MQYSVVRSFMCLYIHHIRPLMVRIHGRKIKFICIYMYTHLWNLLYFHFLEGKLKEVYSFFFLFFVLLLCVDPLFILIIERTPESCLYINLVGMWLSPFFFLFKGNIFYFIFLFVRGQCPKRALFRSHECNWSNLLVYHKELNLKGYFWQGNGRQFRVDSNI